MRHVGRRCQPRLGFKGDIELFSDGKSYTPDRDGSSNISEGGLGIPRLNLPLFTRLKVFIGLPGQCGKKQTLMLDAEVAWRKLSKTGVRFTTPTPPALRQYLAQH